MNKTFSAKVERMGHDGSALALHEGNLVHIHGMLPDEEGIVDATRKNKTYLGVLRELTKASPSRKTPEELHYLSCSPWQVMEYPLQVELKHAVISELFGYYTDAPKAGFTPAAHFYGYRTKVEFSFCDRDGDLEIPLSLAFHERGGGVRRLPLTEGCALVSDAMNRVALTITDKLRAQGYTARDLKTLVVRESKSEGQLLAMLYAKKETIAEFKVDDIIGLAGFFVFHSTEKSPASVVTRALWNSGDTHLSEVMHGVSVRYSWDSFFQNNIPVFLEAVEMMKRYLPTDTSVLELYAGAGTIGLLLAGKVNHVHGIESIESAVESANMNATINAIINYTAECLPAENIDADLLAAYDALVLDPPRAGLHPKLIKDILLKKPKQILYLSCNPETQARDYSELKDAYKIDAIQGFDFYPQTPHLESLLILSLREE